MAGFFNASAVGGPAQGSMSPDAYYQYESEMRRNSNQDLMEWADMHNPRTRAIQRLASIGAVGAAHRDRWSDFLNYSAGGFGVQQGSQMIQGMLGPGSFADMTYGLNQSMANSGSYINMMGRSQVFNGGGAANDAMTKMLSQRLQYAMFDDFGRNKGFGTNGLDPTAIGRYSQILANTGSFAGQESFNFGKLSLADRLKNSMWDLKSGNRINEANMIGDLLKKGGSESDLLAGVNSLSSTAKNKGYTGLVQTLGAVTSTDKGFSASESYIKGVKSSVEELHKIHDAIKDVFADIDDVGATSMMQSITGSSTRLDSLKKARATIDELKTTARSMGVSDQEAFTQASNSGNMFGSLMGQSFGRQYSAQSTIRTLGQQGFLKAQAGAFEDRGMYIPTPTMADSAQQEARYAMGLLNEPASRLQAEAYYQSVYNPNVSNNPELKSRLLSSANAVGASGNEAARQAAYGTLQGVMNPLGRVNMSNNVLLDALSKSAEGKSLSSSLSNQIQNRVYGRSFQAKAAELAITNRGFANGGGQLMQQLYSTLNTQDFTAITSAMSAGNMDQVSSIVNSNDYFFQNNGTSSGQVLDLINSTSKSTGSLAKTGASVSMGVSQLLQQGALSGLENYSAKFTAGSSKAFNDSVTMKVLGNPRSKESIASVLSGFVLSKGTATFSDLDRTKLLAYSGNYSKATAGSNGRLQMTPEMIDSLSKNKVFLGALSDPTQEGFQRLLGQDNNIGEIGRALRASDHVIFGTDEGYGISTKAQQEANESAGSKRALMDYYGITDSQATEYLSQTGSYGDLQSKFNKKRVAEAAMGKPEKFASMRKIHTGRNVGWNAMTALRSGNKDSAHLILEALTQPGMSDSARHDAYTTILGNSDNVSWLSSNVGTISAESIKDGSAYKKVNEALAKVSGDEGAMKAWGPEGAGATMANMTVTNMTVINKN